MQFEAIQYTSDMHCLVCKTRLARRFSCSIVLDRRGEMIRDWGIGGRTWEEMRATYQLRCPCGGSCEFSTPSEANEVAPIFGEIRRAA